MKRKTLTILLHTFFTLMFLLQANQSAIAEDSLMLSPDGRAIYVPSSQMSDWEAVGWINGETPTTIYAPDGRIAQIPYKLLYDYKLLGWSDIPYVLMLAPDGRTLYVSSTQVSDWEAVGWINGETPTNIYAPDGRIAQIPYKLLYDYKLLGWSDEPFVTLYAHAKKQSFPQSQVETYLKLGWSRTYVGDHNWKNATCSSPAICTICGKTDGYPTGYHSYYKSDGKCSVCGKQFLLYEYNGIKIYFCGISSYNHGNWDDDLYINFRIENHSNKTETIQVRDEAINGYMTNLIMSSTVTPGNASLTEACLPSFQFDEVRIENYNQADRFSFRFIFASDYHESNLITLNFE